MTSTDALELKAGDVVVLKSSGPRMTVGKMLDGDESAVCLWFKEKGDELQQATFPTAALKKLPIG